MRVPVLARTTSNHHLPTTPLKELASALCFSSTWLHTWPTGSVKDNGTLTDLWLLDDRWNLCPVLWKLTLVAAAIRLLCTCQYYQAQAAFLTSTDSSVVQWHLFQWQFKKILFVDSSSYVALQPFYRVLAFSTNSFHLLLSWARVFQFGTFNFCISFLISSTQRVFGLPIGLLEIGFQEYIAFTILVPCILSMWPSQLSLCARKKFVMFLRFIVSSSSWLVFMRHIPFSLFGPNIFLDTHTKFHKKWFNSVIRDGTDTKTRQ